MDTMFIVWVNAMVSGRDTLDSMFCDGGHVEPLLAPLSNSTTDLQHTMTALVEGMLDVIKTGLYTLL